MKKFLVFLMIFAFAACHSNKRREKEHIIVFCAASLTDVITELGLEFENEYDVVVKLNLASSGTLARQIEQGAPADIFLSANDSWMDYLYSIGLTENDSVTRCAGNSLVVIVPNNSIIDTIIFDKNTSFPDSFSGRLSIGDPEYVPVGTYAREALQKLGCFIELQNRLLPAKDASSALMVVELGETEAGIVYFTDAIRSKKVRIVGHIPESSHQPIGYYSAIINNHSNKLTTNFHTFIRSKTAQSVWEKYGFKP